MNLWKLAADAPHAPEPEDWMIPTEVDDEHVDKVFYEYRTLYSPVPWPEWDRPGGIPNWEADLRIRWRLKRGGFGEFYWDVEKLEPMEVRSGDGHKISVDEARGLRAFINRPHFPHHILETHALYKPINFDAEQKRKNSLTQKMNSLSYFSTPELEDAVGEAMNIDPETVAIHAENDLPGLEEGDEHGHHVEDQTHWPDEVYNAAMKIMSVIGLVLHEGRRGWWADHKALIRGVVEYISRHPHALGPLLNLYTTGDGERAYRFMQSIEPKVPLVLHLGRGSRNFWKLGG